MSDETQPSNENEIARLTIGDVHNLQQRLIFFEARSNGFEEALRALTEKNKRSTPGMKIANPEFFKGDCLLLANFLSQCKLKFAGEPSKFPDDKSKIFFAGSYLQEPRGA
jgi:hypothetical protein